MAEIPEELKKAQDFHAHLGPYLVIGMRMGEAVTKRLGNQRFTTKILAYTGTTPPLSCIIDGLQLTTPCTVGNGGIKISSEGEARIKATKGQKTLCISLKEEVKRDVEAAFSSRSQEEIALNLWGMPEEELLEVQEDL